MPSLATLILIFLVALGLFWKLRCIRRGCAIDPEADTRKRSVPRHL